MQQLDFFPKAKLFHGGQLAQGRRKTVRPLSARKPIHLVLKATGRVNLFRHRKIIRPLLNRYTERFGIRIYSLSVQRDHVHCLLKTKDRQGYLGFIRSLTGMMARLLGAGLWKWRPFTRVVNWGRDFRRLMGYLLENEREVLGLQEYRPRKPIAAYWDSR